MSRTRASVDLLGVVSTPTDFDDLDHALLDAAESLLRKRGLRKWSLDDVAEASGNGRTTVYRRFGSRDALVHAVLARELRSTLDDIGRAVGNHVELSDKAVAAVSTAVRRLDRSVVDSLLRSDPETFLPFLTTDAGPLLALATSAIGAALQTQTGAAMPAVAEAFARIGLSFVLTRDSVLPLHDPAALEAGVRQLLGSALAH